ncbi:hypothetical protein GCK32_012519, partial [Trichostrongylus colubriformis]
MEANFIKREEGNAVPVLQSAGTKRGQDSFGGPASKRAHVDGDNNHGRIAFYWASLISTPINESSPRSPRFASGFNYGLIVTMEGEHSNNGAGGLSFSEVCSEVLVSVVILTPSIAVGSLIGQNATIMSNLKNEYECIMQKAICLIGIIVEKISECCQGSFDTDQFDFTQVDRANEIKILIPDSSAAVLAEEIKNIRENGSMIQIFYKATEAHSQERIVTLAHDNHRVGQSNVDCH